MEQKKQNEKVRQSTDERRGGRSVIDIVVVLLLIIALVGGVLRWVLGVMQEEKTEDIRHYEVRFTVVDTPQEVLEGFDDLDVVYEYDSGARLGQLIAKTLQIAPVTDSASLGRTSAIGTLLCSGKMSSAGLHVYGTDIQLAVGSTVTVRTERVALVLEITQFALAE